MREHRWKSRLIAWGLAAAGVVLGLGVAVADAQISSASESGVRPSTVIGTGEAATLTGVVTDESTGDPIAGASVMYDRQTMAAPIQTDEAGAFSIANLPAGPHGILITKEGYYPLSRLIDLAADHASFEFSLRPVSTASGSSSIVGKVTDAATGDPLAGATVTYAPADLNSGDPDGILTNAGLIQPPHFVVTNEAGEYEIVGLAAGAYGVSARAEGRLAEGARVEVAEGATATQDFALDPLPLLALGSIQGVVVTDPEGLAIPDAAIHVRPFLPAPEGSINDPTRPGDPLLNLAEIPRVNSREGGYFRINPLYPGSYELIVRAQGFLPARVLVDVRPGDPAATQVRLRRETNAAPGVIEGRVVDAQTFAPGTPPTGIAGATVHLLSAVNVDPNLSPSDAPTLPQGVTTTTDQNGHYRFGQVPAGVYLLVAQAEGFLRMDRLVRLDPNGHVVADLPLIRSTGGGQGVLEGVVGDARTQTPLAGAHVALSAMPQDGTVAPAVIVAEAVTDEQGHYRIEGLPAGGYAAVASAEGYHPRSVPVQVIGGQVTRVNFPLEPTDTQPGGGRIEGVVSDAVNNTPLAGAIVNVMPALVDPNTDPAIGFPVGAISALTDQNGHYVIENIPAGPYQIVAAAPNYQPLGRATSVTAGQTTTENFALTPATEPVRGRIEGVVTDATTQAPIAGAIVHATYLPPPSGDPSTTEIGPNFAASALTDENGHYVIENLPGGAYQIVAAAPDYQPQGRATAVTPGQATTENFALTPNTQPAGGRIEGVVTDAATQAPIAGALVHASNQPSSNGDLTTTTIPSALTDQNGHYVIENIPAGAYRIVAAAADHQPLGRDTSVTAGQTTTENFALQPSQNTAESEISGRVVNGDPLIAAPAPPPVAGATVTLLYSGPIVFIQPPAPIVLVTDPDGFYRAAHLLPGSYYVKVEAQGFQISARPVEAPAGGSVTANFSLTPLQTTGSRIEGKVLDAATGAGIPGATINGNDPNAPSFVPLFTATTDATGSFVVENVPAGAYLISAGAQGYGPANATVSVVAGQTAQVMIRLQSLNTPAASIDGEVRGARPDANGTLQAAPLPGARVVARVAVPGSNTTQIVAETTTNELGRYAFFGLPSGYYQIVASAQGYSPATQGAQLGQTTVHLNFLLQPATTTNP